MFYYRDAMFYPFILKTINKAHIQTGYEVLGITKNGAAFLDGDKFVVLFKDGNLAASTVDKVEERYDNITYLGVISINDEPMLFFEGIIEEGDYGQTVIEYGAFSAVFGDYEIVEEFPIDGENIIHANVSNAKFMPLKNGKYLYGPICLDYYNEEKEENETNCYILEINEDGYHELVEISNKDATKPLGAVSCGEEWVAVTKSSLYYGKESKPLTLPNVPISDYWLAGRHIIVETDMAITKKKQIYFADACRLWKDERTEWGFLRNPILTSNGWYGLVSLIQLAIKDEMGKYVILFDSYAIPTGITTYDSEPVIYDIYENMAVVVSHSNSGYSIILAEIIEQKTVKKIEIK